MKFLLTLLATSIALTRAAPVTVTRTVVVATQYVTYTVDGSPTTQTTESLSTELPASSVPSSSDYVAPVQTMSSAPTTTASPSIVIISSTVTPSSSIVTPTTTSSSTTPTTTSTSTTPTTTSTSTTPTTTSTSTTPTTSSTTPTTTSTTAPTTTSTSTSSTSTSSTTTSTTSSSLNTFEAAILAEHNAKRALHGAKALTWDSTLAQYAANYAASSFSCDNVQLIHSGGPYGENLAAGYVGGAAPVDAWYDEISSYDYSNPGFSEATGHFTQVVWASTDRVGCAMVACSNVWRQYTICEYAPAGNVIGYFPENVYPLVN